MPEGPSILILKEAVAQFRGQRVEAVSGNTTVDKDRALGQTVVDFKTWGKHFLICFHDFTIKIHLMLFGSFRINEEKATPPRLSLKFANGVLNFYACSVKIIDEDLDELYDWSADVLSDVFDAVSAKRKLQEHPDMLVCDALLNQEIFAGVGNIIKNEVLFRIRVHPLSTIRGLSTRKLNEMIHEARNYSFDFLNWKKEFVLRKHWLVHNKSVCPRCQRKLCRAYLGEFNRRTFYCEKCQTLYPRKTTTPVLEKQLKVQGRGAKAIG